MNTKRFGAAAAALILVGGLGACSAEPEPAASPTPSEGAASSPASASPTSRSVVEGDPWLERIEPERTELLTWWEGFKADGCDAADPGCFDQFAEGRPLLEDLHGAVEAVASWAPEYAGLGPAGKIFLTSRAMERWEAACADPRGDCPAMADSAEESVEDLTEEISAWGF
ncbi:hypothetical protein [Zhihengliuella sp.]|uniref:hypothetical protein n=1 Tax=Zhihengliuella sp. TaxID=1954483 RepID=UPI002812420D|nr:hypothetical protein [Zhihengliuella sp.]